MKSVVLPVCPYCGMRYEGAELPEKLSPHTRLVRCERCKERYYISLQHRYIGRKNFDRPVTV